jgi:hypothetical protein
MAYAREAAGRDSASLTGIHVDQAWGRIGPCSHREQVSGEQSSRKQKSFAQVSNYWYFHWRT